jgi:hypothetical protein
MPLLSNTGHHKDVEWQMQNKIQNKQSQRITNKMGPDLDLYPDLYFKNSSDAPRGTSGAPWESSSGEPFGWPLLFLGGVLVVAHHSVPTGSMSKI